MNLIGVAGQMSSGKDAFSSYLVDKLNEEVYKRFLDNLAGGKSVEENLWNCRRSTDPLWTRVAFADGIKKLMSDIFDVDVDFIEKWKRKDELPPDYLMTVRQALQFIGDGFRQIKPLVWIDLALRYNTPKVVSDCRYINELKAIKDKGGINILLYRPGFENDIDHPSESQLRYLMCSLGGMIDRKEVSDLIDLIVCNDGTLEDLYRKIDTVVIPYLKGKENDSNSARNG